MTDANSDGQADEHAGQRMNRVLQAERDAKRAIAECQRLVSRADQRITVIQMRCNHRIDMVVKAIEKQQQEPAATAHPGQLGEQSIRSVVAAVAAALTGAEDATPGARHTRA